MSKRFDLLDMYFYHLRSQKISIEVVDGAIEKVFETDTVGVDNGFERKSHFLLFSDDGLGNKHFCLSEICSKSWSRYSTVCY